MDIFSFMCNMRKILKKICSIVKREVNFTLKSAFLALIMIIIDISIFLMNSIK